MSLPEAIKSNMGCFQGRERLPVWAGLWLFLMAYGKDHPRLGGARQGGARQGAAGRGVVWQARRNSDKMKSESASR